MKRQAFTLIELAISLSIIGLMIGGSFQATKALRERTKIAEAKEQIKAAKDAVMGYAMEWVDLPTSTEFDANISPNTGTLKPISYFIDPILANDVDICAFKTTNLKVVTPDRNITDVAFVVAAAGPNYNMQTTLDTSVTPNTVNIYGADKLVNNNFYDDIVESVTLAELQGNVNCSKNKLVIINDYALPRDSNSSPSYVGADIFAIHGIPFADGVIDTDTELDYQWCLEDSNTSSIWQLDCGSSNYPAVQNCSIVTPNPYFLCTSPRLTSGSNHPTAGTYSLKIYVKDSTQNEAVKKSFSIAIDAIP